MDREVQQIEDLVDRIEAVEVDTKDKVVGLLDKERGSKQSVLLVPSKDLTGQSEGMSSMEAGQRRLYQDSKNTAQHGRDAGTEGGMESAVVVDEVIEMMQFEI